MRWPAAISRSRPADFALKFGNTLFRSRVAVAAGSASRIDVRWQTNMSGTEKSKLEKARRLAKKKSAAQLISVRSGPTFHVDEAIRIMKAVSSAGDQTVDIQVQLGIDPKKTDQNVRGVASLPHGTGKKVLVAVFAKGEKAEEARKAGAHLVGAEDLVERISKGELDFNKTIATPDMMPLVGKVARILGPRGLMPNPKLGTVTVNVKEAVSAAQRGQASFKSEKRGIVSTGIGKVRFGTQELKDNLRAFMVALNEAKPDTVKGIFLRQVVLSSTHGVGLPLDLTIVDPSSPTFMREWDGSPAALGVAQITPARAAATMA